ncbi:hypothetical protein [Paenibacillus alginolyticus]|uniref:Uncharacterized protein n=1 Tax=Paenibacillus alginolyticus TaxID=59839 RepID=A0ABT4G796_9BACL|nr:hypothetical protein [Paenibacillus alginolyticus]MCY9692054.1 hypothetical protein [Paenibacillus alginolyticus]MEC0144244.1 hypothetical protein [Paenibacillus alginolyticus]
MGNKKSSMGIRIYSLVFFPVLSALFFVLIPAWSLRVAQIVLLIIVCNLFVWILLKPKNVDKIIRKTNVIFVICQIDLFSLFILGVFWRVWGGTNWLAGLLLVIFLCSAIVGHRYRKIVLQEAIAPRTKLGITLLVMGFVGPAFAGGLVYALGNLLEHTVGTTVMMKCLTAAFVPISIYLVTILHASWLKVEQPDWKPIRRK